jgi:Uma2 family endonuclease
MNPIMSQSPAVDCETPFRSLRLKMLPAVSITHEQFFDLCQQNDDLRLERTAQGELIIMTPAGGGTSARNSSVNAQLYYWCEGYGSGMVFDSNGGFTLPNGATCAPDAAWVSGEQMALITDEQLEHFLPLCPDFVIEILSPTESVRRTLQKMEEYIANGAKLGWLINPRNEQVHVYRSGQDVQILENPSSLAGDPELPGFTLNLEPVWRPR